MVGRSKPTGLYAIKADGTSMNRAQIDGKSIDDGDYVIIDSQLKEYYNTLNLPLISDKIR